MKASTIFGRASAVLAIPACLFSLLLYFYPLFLGCSFPKPASITGLSAYNFGDKTPPLRAPFRLLALGDPQLEGDSSLPEQYGPIFQSVREIWNINRSSGILSDLSALSSFLKIALSHDIPRLLWSYRKRLDLFGNDYYLAHIYRTLHWWLAPTHVTVLGDLIGSQWVSDEEFEKRGSRFWDIVFKPGKRVEDSVTGVGSTEYLGQDARWAQRVINVAGNHDIGYAGDLDPARLARFETTFGKANWDVKLQVPKANSTGVTEAQGPPELHLIILNNMNLDSPAYDPELQRQTYEFINSQVIATSRPVEDRTSGTIVLTHIPLHKEAGVCVDGPFFAYSQFGVREQNHLSPPASSAILEGIFGISARPDAPANGVGRNGVILTGHDHEGCDVYHYTLPGEDPGFPQWRASKWKNAGAAVAGGVARGVREITVRSMMGSYGGNAGLLSAWFDYDIGEWRFEYATCPLGVQHIWWAVHILDLITLMCGAVAALLVFGERLGTQSRKPAQMRPKKEGKIPHINGNSVATGRQQNTPISKRRSKNNLRAGARAPHFINMLDSPKSK